MHQLSTGTSYLFSAALLGAILALIALLPTVASAQEGPPEQVTICHRPGTPAEQTKMIPSTALQGHLGHGDTEGSCDGDGDTCPCAASGSAMELHRLFLRQEFDSALATDQCLDDGSVTQVIRQAVEGVPILIASVTGATAEFGGACAYSIVNGNEQIIIEEYVEDLQTGEVESCRKDIRKLIAKLDDCPNP